MNKNLHRIRGALVVCLAVQDGKPRDSPTEFRIFPAGSFNTIYGPFVFDAESAKTVLAHREARGVDLRVDQEHASEHVDSAADPAEAGTPASTSKPAAIGRATTGNPPPDDERDVPPAAA